MSKTVRIFRKDIRHFWPEITLSLIVTLTFVMVERWGWPFFNGHLFPQAPAIRTFVNVLLPITWWLLVARIVHDEPLVGDRQFWITRPYTWSAVLMAKLLSVLVFIAAPLFVAKCVLLRFADISIVSNLSALLLNVFCTLATLVLLFFLLATVTRTLVRMFFVGVACAAYLGLMFFLGAQFIVTTSYGPDTTSIWATPLVCLVCASVIWFQYAFRRTTASRIILSATIVLVTSYVFINESTWTPHRAYQDVIRSEQPPFTLALVAPSQASASSLPTAPADDDLEPATDAVTHVDVPLRVSGIIPGHAVRIDHLELSYTLPDGTPGPFFGDLGQRPLLTDTFYNSPYLVLNNDLYKEMKDRPLQLKLTLAVTEFVPARSASINMHRGRFAVPFGGYCGHPTGGLGRESSLECQFPIGRPPFTLVTTRWSKKSCDTYGNLDSLADGWLGSETNDAFEVNYDPVDTEFLQLASRTWNDSTGDLLCEATPMTFTEFRVLRRRLITVSLSFFPRDYVAPRRVTVKDNRPSGQ